MLSSNEKVNLQKKFVLSGQESSQWKKGLVGVEDFYQECAGCAHCVQWRLNSQGNWFKKQSYKLSMSDFPKLYLATLWAHPCCTSQFARLACCCCLSPRFWIGLDNDNTTVVNCLFSCDDFDYSVTHTLCTDKSKAVLGGVTVLQTWREHLPENGSWIIIG